MVIAKAKTIPKPWGKEEILINTENYVMKRIWIDSGHRMSLQYHESKEETIYVVEGVLVIWSSENFDDHITLVPGDVYHVKPNTVHRFGAPNECGTMILECSSTALSDVVRLADDYNRD